jgi:tape measure domain-containing protein
MNSFNVRILIEAIDQASRPIRNVVQKLRELANSQGMQKLRAAMTDVKKAMGSVVNEAGLLVTRLGALAAVGGLAFKKLIFDQMTSWENLEQSLKGLLGGSKQAQKAMAWIADFAKRTPMDVQGVADTFRMMTALGLKPMQGQMEAIVDTASALGGSQETMRRIALALGQAWTKQKLQGEEILQLTEAGVSVWDLLAKATGKNTQTLQTLSSAGKLGRKEIQLLIDSLGKKYKGAAVGMANTTAGIIANLQDAWQRFTLILYQENLLDYFKTELKGLLDQVDAMADSGQLKQFAIEFKSTVISIFQELKTAVQQAWPVIQGLALGFVAFSKAVGGYGNVLKILIAILSAPFVVSIIKAGIALFNFGQKIFELVKAGQWVQKAFLAIRAVMAILSGPVGWIIAGITVLAAVAFLIIRNWSQVRTWFTSMWQEWGGVIRLLVPPIDAIIRLAGAVRAAWGPTQRFFQQLFSAIASAVKQAAVAFQPLIDAANQVKDAIAGIMSAARTKIAGAVSTARTKIGGTIQDFKGFANQATGHNPGRAHGGFVRRNMAYQVGEFGRELFVPGADGRILSSNSLRSLGGSSERGNINIHLKIDSEGRPRLAGMDQKGTKANLSLDMGLINSYG